MVMVAMNENMIKVLKCKKDRNNQAIPVKRKGKYVVVKRCSVNIKHTEEVLIPVPRIFKGQLLGHPK